MHITSLFGLEKTSVTRNGFCRNRSGEKDRRTAACRMENASKLKKGGTLHETLPCRPFVPGSFHNQGEAETPVFGGDLAGGAEHGGLRFLEESIAGIGLVISGSGWIHNREMSGVRIFLPSRQEQSRRSGGRQRRIKRREACRQGIGIQKFHDSDRREKLFCKCGFPGTVRATDQIEDGRFIRHQG